MGMTDPIADMLTRVRNAASARHDKTEMPWGRIKEQIARVLLAEGYVRDVVTAGQGATKTLTVMLRYTENGEAAITGIRRVSRPGMRVYSVASGMSQPRSGPKRRNTSSLWLRSEPGCSCITSPSSTLMRAISISMCPVKAWASASVAHPLSARSKMIAAAESESSAVYGVTAA